MPQAVADLRGARGTRAPPVHNFFIFMQFSGKIGQIIGWHPPPFGVSAPSSGKSWIRHCQEVNFNILMSNDPHLNSDTACVTFYFAWYLFSRKNVFKTTAIEKAHTRTKDSYSADNDVTSWNDAGAEGTNKKFGIDRDKDGTWRDGFIIQFPLES